jgi:multimeric flavodoxin WrbA
MKRILGINGSPRKNGNSDILLQHILEACSEIVDSTELIYLRDLAIKPCTACERCRNDKACTGVSDDMQSIYLKIEEAQGLVLVSPVYFYNITAQMKTFIDRLYCYFDFGKKRPGEWSSRLAGKGRKALTAVIGEQHGREEGGIDIALAAMRRPLESLGYEVIDEIPVSGIFKRGWVKHYPDILENAEESGRRLANSIIEQI